MELLNTTTPCFRPIQYLGNKLRVLDEICDAVNSLIGHNGVVADLFTGSTIVAQALAGYGHSVTTVDSQLYSKVLANACLSIGRIQNETCIADEFIRYPLPESTEKKFELWGKYADIEEKMLTKDDSDGLRELYDQLPLIWRDKNDPNFGLAEKKITCSSYNTMPLITKIYAGYYFGIKQALELDRLRHTIFLLHKSHLISDWQMNVALASLLSAASAVVHSAGKHFAQPLSTSRTRNNNFKDKRLLQDRKISVEDSFKHCCAMINQLIVGNGSQHNAYCDTAEHFLETNKCNFDLLYLDPPYTAQQYSRFYHILETICTYKPPNLLNNGQITTGLYPSTRFKSAFCSKVNALPTMKKIIQKAKESNTCLLISYSFSNPGSYGNARMISFKELLEVCKQQYGSVAVESSKMKHRYRQFNNKHNTNEQRNDPEVLISCKND